MNCCDRHNVTLCESDTKPSRNHLYLANDWIDLDADEPEPAPPIDVQIAKDIRWIYAQKSSLHIDPAAFALGIDLALRNRGLARKGFLSGSLHRELFSRYGSSYIRSFLIGLKVNNGIGLRRLSLGASLMLVNFLDYKLPEFVSRICQFDTTEQGKTRINWAAAELNKLLSENRGLSRVDIFRARPYAANLLRKYASDHYESLVPKARSNLNNRRDWASLDAKYVEALKVHFGRRTDAPMSQTMLLQAAGVSIHWKVRNKKKLPLTISYLKKISFGRRKPARIRRSNRANALEFARRKLNRLRTRHPLLSATAFRKFASSAYRQMLKHSPNEIPIRAKMDWSKRDREMRDLLNQKLPSLSLDVRCSARRILRALNEPEQLIRYGAAKLPLVISLIKSTVSSSRVERKSLTNTRPVRQKAHIGRFVDWYQRDKLYVQTISTLRLSLSGQQQTSSTRVLKAVGISHFALILAKGRLPNTEALLAEIVKPYDLLEAKRKKLLLLIKRNPDLGRDAIRNLDRTTVDGVLAADREFYNRVMPTSRGSGSAFSELV